MQIQGLSAEEVAQRKQAGLVNRKVDVVTKSVGQIILSHTLTLFNLLNFALALALLLVGSFKNMLFMGVVLSNTAIGVVQEIRSKRMVDRLAIVVSNRVQVIRDGKPQDIPIEEIVQDDYICLQRGNQVAADSRVVEGECFANESLLTGEADSIDKRAGDSLLSGSFIISGSCIAQVEHVGSENYAAQISVEAKEIKAVKSEIMTTLKKIIKVISFIIVPLGLFLFYNQYTLPDATLEAAVIGTVAGMIGMIPEGLMLLTSTVLAVSIIRLSGHKVLVQQLYCIETLARVDVLCLDKTGTITCEEMQVEKVIAMPEISEAELHTALAALAASSRDEGATIDALRAYFTEQVKYKAEQIIDFSSESKWSGARYDNGLSYVIGAGEMIMGDRYSEMEKRIHSQLGTSRILFVAKSYQPFLKVDGKMRLPESLIPMGFVLIQDKIRPEAAQTIQYFCDQQVRLKVISGDGVGTVSRIAKQAGIPEADQAIDARTLETDEEIKEAVEKYHIFARVTPVQKRRLIKALKANGHTVAMTGDGVNDVLALKEADCSVAMASGSDAARNVAQLVLTDNDFSAMPKVVAEGRRSINNIQRSASLFLVKTLFSICTGILFVFMNLHYPFQPIQMSFIGMFTIGLPSFILALEPNKERIQGNFFYNIITRAVAGAFTMVLGILVVYIAGKIFRLSQIEISTLAVIITAATGVFLLIRISIPFNFVRSVLLGVVLGGLVCGVLFFGELLNLAPLSLNLFIFLLGTGLVNAAIFTGLYHIMEQIRQNKA